MNMKINREIVQLRDINFVNVNNVNRNINNNDTNVTGKQKYALDRSKFKPNTEEAILAEEISSKFNDLNNFAFHLSTVNRLGISETRRLFSEILGEIKEKHGTKYEIRKPAAYFVWKIKHRY